MPKTNFVKDEGKPWELLSSLKLGSKMNHGFYTLMVSTGSELCVCACVYACARVCVHSGAGAEAVSVSERKGWFPSFCCSHYFNAPFLNFCHLLPNPNPLSISGQENRAMLIVKRKNSISLHLILKFSNSQGWYLWKWEPRVLNIINGGEGRDGNRTKLIISGNPCGDQKFGNDDNQQRCASEKTVDKDNPSIFAKICYHQVCLNIYHPYSIKDSAMIPRMIPRMISMISILQLILVNFKIHFQSNLPATAWPRSWIDHSSHNQ